MDTKLLLELIDTEINGLLGITEAKEGGKSFDIQAAWDSIPLPQISELGWADPNKKGGAPTNEQRAELAGYMTQIGGKGLEKLNKLQAVLENPGKHLRSASLGRVLSFLTFYKTITYVITNFNPSTAGFLFESILGTLTGGQQIPAKGAGGGETIADFSFKLSGGGEEYISLKLLGGTSTIDGSFVDLVNDLVVMGKMTYVVILKDIEEGGGTLDFYKIDFDRQTFVALSAKGESQQNKQNLRILGAHGRRLRGDAGAAGEITNWEQFVDMYGAPYLMDEGLPEELVSRYLGYMKSADPDEHNPRKMGDFKAAIQQEEEHAEKILDAFSALKKQFDSDKATQAAEKKSVSGEKNFLSYEKSLEYLRKKSDKDFWNEIQNYSFGYLTRKRFSFTQPQVISEVEGGKPFVTLKVGQEVIQETLNAIITETNEKMFDIFKELKVLSTGLREFFMKGMKTEQGKVATNAATQIQIDTEEMVKGAATNEQTEE